MFHIYSADCGLWASWKLKCVKCRSRGKNRSWVQTRKEKEKRKLTTTSSLAFFQIYWLSFLRPPFLLQGFRGRWGLTPLDCTSNTYNTGRRIFPSHFTPMSWVKVSVSPWYRSPSHYWDPCSLGSHATASFSPFILARSRISFLMRPHSMWFLVPPWHHHFCNQQPPTYPKYHHWNPELSLHSPQQGVHSTIISANLKQNVYFWNYFVPFLW